MAESGGNPKDVGDRNLTFYDHGRLVGMSCGLMQVRVLRGRPDCDVLLDPHTNMEWAWRIYSERGNFTAWSTYNNGAYKQYL